MNDEDKTVQFYSEGIFGSIDVLEEILAGVPVIVLSGIPVIANEAVGPHEAWVVSGRGRGMQIVRQSCHVSRAFPEGLMRHRLDAMAQLGPEYAETHAIVNPETAWALRVMLIETDPMYRHQLPTMQRHIAYLATHARAGLDAT